jgi:hypothetical protein
LAEREARLFAHRLVGVRFRRSHEGGFRGVPSERPESAQRPSRVRADELARVLEEGGAQRRYGFHGAGITERYRCISLKLALADSP